MKKMGELNLMIFWKKRGKRITLINIWWALRKIGGFIYGFIAMTLSCQLARIELYFNDEPLSILCRDLRSSSDILKLSFVVGAIDSTKSGSAVG